MCRGEWVRIRAVVVPQVDRTTASSGGANCDTDAMVCSSQPVPFRDGHGARGERAHDIAVVVIAGGKSQRFGTDKALWIPPGSTQTNTARLASLGECSVVVRGSHLPLIPDVDASTQVSEDPPGSGPAMAAHRGLLATLSARRRVWGRADDPKMVLLVACDLLGFDQLHVDQGLAALSGPDARDIDAVVFHIHNEPHWLASLWRWRGRTTFADAEPNAPARALYAQRRWRRVDAVGVVDQNRPPRLITPTPLDRGPERPRPSREDGP